MSGWRVAVVDDEAGYARAVADVLDAEPDLRVVGVGANGVEAVTLARESQPHVLLLDLAMPVMGGLEALRQIRRECPSVEVLILTVQEDDASVFEALRAGAKGYLLKEALLDGLASAVRDVAHGRGVLPAPLAARVLTEFGRLSAQSAALQRLYSLLTHKEAEVLKLIEGGLTNRLIADALFIEEKTVKTHVTSILKKLEVNTRTEAALIARRSGINGIVTKEITP